MDDRALTPPRQPHSTQSQDTDRQVAGVIARLLLHYYSPGDLSEAARKAMAQDWVEDLAEFGAAVVADACQEWRRSQHRRPVPSELRKLCSEMRRVNQDRRALAAPHGGSDDYARSVGWASEAERLAAIRRDERDRDARYERARLVREQVGAARPLAKTAAALGVKAREYTAAELRAGRIALGLEQADDTTTAATTAA